jgi:nucleotide-binding universal stress UspA family protein
MWDRVLFAIDQFESGQVALKFAIGLADATGAEVRVLHIREISRWARVPPLETPAEAELLVQQAVFALRIAGVGAEGLACSLPEDQVAKRIIEEARRWSCDAIVLGTRRLHGIHRLSGRGRREQILRASPLPLIAAPTASVNAIYSPPRLRPATTGLDEDRRIAPPAIDF